MAALNSLVYLVYSILTLTANNKPATDPSLSAWEVGSESQATETWDQENYTTRNYDAEKCPPGETWSDCDAGCETTCETVGQPQICPRMCVPGCVCEQPGEVRGPNKQCIAPPLCPKEEKKACDDKPDTGLCRGYFPMWYYDDSNSDCKKFIYGGCGGNGNKYKTKEECLRSCANIWPDSDDRKPDDDRCALPAETGLCKGRFPRYYFEKETGQCKEFVYGGCGGNENNFKSAEECQQTCGNHADNACRENERPNDCATACPLTCENYKNPPKVCPFKCFIGCECKKGFVRRGDGKCVKPEQCPKIQDAEEHDSDRCSQPTDTGLCHGNLPRFYFDKEVGQCKKFAYSGCGGNENNFKTEEECQQACRKQHIDFCGENEQYNDCGTFCPLTCENYKNPDKSCLNVCNSGCECKQGFVRRQDRKCVKRDQCTKKGQ